jgi:hypothetical protein
MNKYPAVNFKSPILIPGLLMLLVFSALPTMMIIIAV